MADSGFRGITLSYSAGGSFGLAGKVVAMRRIGGSLQPLPEDKNNQLADLQAEWADISPRSPSRICAIRAERQARREEKFVGQRRSNLD